MMFCYLCALSDALGAHLRSARTLNRIFHLTEFVLISSMMSEIDLMLSTALLVFPEFG